MDDDTMIHEYCISLCQKESRSSNGMYSIQYHSLSLSELPDSGFLLPCMVSVPRHQRYACEFDMGIDGDTGGMKWTGEWSIDRSKATLHTTAEDDSGGGSARDCPRC